MKKGFTLIELLVVVLVIGILAAVALPQYQKAVEKSRFTQQRLWAKRIRDAEREFYMANGSWSYDFESLSMDIPAGSTFSSSFGDPRAIVTLPAGFSFALNSNNMSLQFSYKNTTFSMPFSTGKLACYYYVDESKKKFCSILAEDPEACAASSINACVVASL